MTWACDRVISPSRMSEREETSSLVTGISFSGNVPSDDGICEM